MTRLRHVAEQVVICDATDPKPFVALEHLESRSGRLVDGVELPVHEPHAASMVSFTNGDVLFGKLRPYLAKSWRADREGYCSSELIVMRPKSGTDSRWLGYLAQSDLMIDWSVATSEGVKMPRTSWEKLRLLEVPYRTPDSQRALADRLDRETARIDRLLGRYRLLAEKLGERRSFITTAGVAGLPFAGPRREARLPWMPSLPSHWEEAKLTLLTKLGTGHTPSREHPEWWVDCTIPWITTGEVWQIRDDRVEYLVDTRERISELGLANSAAELHPAGTVVLSRTASAGFSAIMATDMATSQDFVTWTCGPRIRPRYLLLCLRAMRADLLGRLAMGSTHKTIYFPDIQSIRVPVPPLADQDEMVEWVWSRLRRIDAAVEAIEGQIRLLRERRQALITAAVAGGIEVVGVPA